MEFSGNLIATSKVGDAMTQGTAPKQWGPRKALPTRLADDLRGRLARWEWSPGDKLPSEAELVETYGVSRATVRQAIKTLESQGLVVTRHGRGTFVADGSVIRAGMQELTSITSTVAEMGHVPSMNYHHRLLRPATLAEVAMFDIAADSTVLDIQRRILADGSTVAYSYDILPRWVFPDAFRPEQLDGSVFAFLAQHQGPVPVRAVARVHAVNDPAVAWDDELQDEQLFILLDQLHYDQENRPFMHTRSYFIEGRFNFTVVRHSPNR
jgi:GntR family transcriptional regulator